MQSGEIEGAVQLVGLFMVKAGGTVIDNIALLFAVGIGVGLAEERDGTAGMAALVSWLMMTLLLSPDNVCKLMPSISDNKTALLAFSKIQNPFIGILAGNIGAACYNRFKDTVLPEWLGFFSGKRSAVIVSGLASVLAAAVLFFIWPVIFGGLVSVGNTISEQGAAGAGIYAFFNRLLLPFGLHHALNNVFWFDTIGLGDLTHFWAGETSADVSWSLGMYMSGFFPCMMFGIPGAALAMVHSAPKGKRKFVRGILISGAVCSFVCGITEPFEFAFMFAAPVLYVVYAFLYGIFTFVATLVGFRAGFAFSGGVTDLFFSASMPAAQNTWLIIPLGIAAFAVFYAVFRVLITKFKLKTPGRDDDERLDDMVAVGNGAYGKLSGGAKSMTDTVAGVHIGTLLEGLGGIGNIATLDHCITRLRLEMKDISKISEEMIRQAGAKGIMKIGKNGLQVVIGLNVQAVADALSEKMRNIPQTIIIRCESGIVLQPVKGKVIPLEEIPDETFSAGILGQGVGICPEDDVVSAPFDGIITSVTDTRHAVAIEGNGMEVLIHIGIDTVKMKGDGFICEVSEGDAVKAGQTLIRFDRQKIQAAGLKDIVAVTLTNSDDMENVKCGI